MTIPRAADYLDRLIESSIQTDRSIRYDADIADATGITRQTISHYRAGRNMSVIAAIKIAKLLGIHQMEAVAASMYHQATTEDDKKLWRETYYEYKDKKAE